MTDVAIGQGFDIGRVIERAFSSIRHNLGPFLLLSVVFGGLPQLVLGIGQAEFSANAADPLTGIVVMLVGLFLLVAGSLILQAALVRGTVSYLSGQKSTLGELFQTGVRFALPLLGLGIIYMLMLMIGFMLLVVPFFIVLSVFSVSAPVLVSERKGVFGSFQRSRDLTRGHRWSVFGVLVVFWVISIVIGMIVGVIGLVAGVGIGGGLSSVGSVELLYARAGVNAVSGVFQGLLTAAAIASIYYELRTIKDGAAPHALLSVFD